MVYNTYYFSLKIKEEKRIRVCVVVVVEKRRKKRSIVGWSSFLF